MRLPRNLLLIYLVVVGTYTAEGFINVVFAPYLQQQGVPMAQIGALVAALALATAGWYPLLKARLYGALGEASGLALTVGALFPLNAVLPLAVAGLAERWGLAAALWLLLAAPAALLVLVPRRKP